MKNQDAHTRRGRPMPEQKAPSIPQSPPPPPEAASQVWKSLPWRALEQQVQHLQARIAQASQQGDPRTVHTLQQQLFASEAARLLAVRRVTQDNEGKDTAGVDGVKSFSILPDFSTNFCRLFQGFLSHSLQREYQLMNNLGGFPSSFLKLPRKSAA
jgi:hypothetical protein